MLCLERQYLIISLVSDPVSNDGVHCTFGNRFFQTCYLSGHLSDAILREADLLPHDVNLVLQVMVLAHGVI